MEDARALAPTDGQRRSLATLIALFLIGIVTLASAATTEAAVVANPDKSPFKAAISGGQLTVNTKLNMDVGTMSPAPTLNNVTLDADGNRRHRPPGWSSRSR